MDGHSNEENSHERLNSEVTSDNFKKDQLKKHLNESINTMPNSENKSGTGTFKVVINSRDGERKKVSYRQPASGGLRHIQMRHPEVKIETKGARQQDYNEINTPMTFGHNNSTV